jgi:hypothetical protein
MKKKTILLIFMILLNFSAIVKAQDTIVTNKNQHIPAKILEIDTDEIKFKYFNLQNVVQAIATKNVIHIIYENGTKIVFCDDTIAQNARENLQEKYRPAISRSEFYKLKDTEILKLMSEFDLTNKNLSQFKYGYDLRKSGNHKIGFGAAITCMSAFCYLYGVSQFTETDYNNENYHDNSDGSINAIVPASVAGMIIGEIVIASGTVMRIISGIKRNKAKDRFFNEHFSMQRQPSDFSISLSLKPVSAGLVLNF